MKTLRVRLMGIIGLSFTILWLAASVWMFLDVRTKFRDALDERLAASARMVAGLVSQIPDSPVTPSSVPQSVLDVVAKDGVACEVQLLHGGLVARTHNSPTGLSQAHTGYSTRTMRGEQWRSYTLEQGGKRVTTADRVEKRQALLNNIIVATVVPFVIAMLGSLVVLWFGIRQGLAPLESIRQALAERKADAVTPLPAARVPAELTQFVQTINQLLDRTLNAIERERRFTGDAAHELRTPLTIIKTHIQVAQLTADDATATALEHAEEGVQRLQRTLEQLLMLARVEGAFSFAEEEAATAKEVAELALHEIPAHSKQRIIVDSADTACRVGVPPSLAATALRNLIDNALRYSPADSPIMLRMNSKDAWFCFAVLDEGESLSDADRSQVVQRFWRKGTGQGSGLGLSIVDAIVKRFGGTFSLLAHGDTGTIAKIEFPCIPKETGQSTIPSALPA